MVKSEIYGGSAYVGSASYATSIASEVLGRERGSRKKRSACLVGIETEIWAYQEHKNESGRASLRGI